MRHTLVLMLGAFVLASMLCASGRVAVAQEPTTAAETAAAPAQPDAAQRERAVRKADATSALPSPAPEVEPNNTLAQATPLLLSDRPNAIAHGSIRQGGDVDIYSFTAPANARLWALVDAGGTLNPGSNYRDTVLSLLDANGVELEKDDDDGTSTGCNGTVESELASVIGGKTLTAGGTYYLRVRAFSATRAIDAYQLFLHLTVGAVAETEPNNTTGQAQAVTATASVSGAISPAGDADVYVVAAGGAGNILFVAADGDPERDGTDTNLKLELFDTDGVTLLLAVNSAGSGYSPTPQGEGFCFRVYKAGAFYVKVSHATGGTGTYGLMAGVLDGGAAPLTDKVAVASSGTWSFRGSLSGGGLDFSFAYQGGADKPLLCDWDGNGTRTPGTFNNGQWTLRNSLSAGAPDATFNFGQAGDIPICGDWNGDGLDTVGVMRNGIWYLRNSNTSGPAEISFFYGAAGDVPLVGDWNGDGVDGVGVFRNGDFLLRDALSSGNATDSLNFGLPTDKPVIGDWDGDGDDNVGVFRAGQWFLRNSLTPGPADAAFTFGGSGDTPLTWR